MMPVAKPGWRPLVVTTQILILGLFVAHALVVNYVVDVSFISYRYAQHLRDGHGLVYNIGERVEGYTNFLWVIFLACTQWLLPFLTLPTIASFGGMTAAVITIVLAFRLSASVTGQPQIGLLAALLLAVHSGFAAWAPAGLETPLFSMLVFAGAISGVQYLHVGRGMLWVPIWFGLAALTRADGALFFGATIAAMLAIDLRRGGWAGLWRPIQAVGIFCAIYVPYLTWRYLYYGDLVPNTAYAKVGGGWTHVDRGLHYIWGYVLGYGVLVWLLPVVLLLWRSREAWLWYLVWLIGVGLAYVTYIGGDGLGFDRFIVPLAPMMYFVVAMSLVGAYRTFRRSLPVGRLPGFIGALVVAIIVVATVRSTALPLLFPERVRWFEPQSGLSFPGNGQDHSYRWFINYFVGRLTIAARYLDEHAPPNSLVASTPAGAIAYYMDHRVIDMLGLTDKHIARTEDRYRGTGTRAFGRAGHEKGDGAYVLSRSPDYILMGNVAVLPYPLTDETMAQKLVNKSEHELWADPEFHRRYELVSVRLASSGPFQYFTFYRKKR